MNNLNFNLKVTEFSSENALLFGKAAKLAYDAEDKIKEETEKWGFEKFEFFDKEESQAFVAANEETIILVFRGTEPNKIQDWMTDAKIRLEDAPGNKGKIHRGFKKGLSYIWDEIHKKIDELYQNEEQTLWVAGHSLGAALATLAVAELREKGKIVTGLYTFGQPRTGNKDFAKNLDSDLKSQIFRFVNNNDIVTRVPPRGLIFKYRHVGTLKYFDTKGNLRNKMGWFRKLLDRIRGRIDDLGKIGTDGMKDHGMDRYIKNLEKNL